MVDDAPESQAPKQREHWITDMHIIAWAITVIAFGTIWIAFQLTLIAGDL